MYLHACIPEPVILATIHPALGVWAVPACMADSKYCGGTFYLPTHHGTKVYIPYVPYVHGVYILYIYHMYMLFCYKFAPTEL